MADLTVSANVDTMLQAANNAAIRSAIGAASTAGPYNGTLGASTPAAVTATTIVTTGNVGIGEATPTYKLVVDDDASSGKGLHVLGGGSGNTLARFERNVGSTGSYIDINCTSNDPQIHLAEGSDSWTVGVESNIFEIVDGTSLTGTSKLEITTTTATFSTDVVVGGALSKASGTFRIPHPLPEKTKTHNLVHSFIEGPQADLIYRGKIKLVEGSATVNIDTASGMTDGTFVTLCRDVQSFTTNESGWSAVKSNVDGNILTIESQDASTDSISWMVIGERQDVHMYDTNWTDADGKPIIEPLIDSIDAGGQSSEVIAEEERLDAEIRNKQKESAELASLVVDEITP